ncbi:MULTISPECIES: DUF3052 family protein [Streptacidiphilus]|uniref:DUF3052 family protein n=1 Tax=Streptacidiphilus cavernicola TaxID=3342716 RepID=A0ABV6UJ38_9ACTN|nr:DUF3052 family protein [Streptacidiphilus jeojiense]
MAETAPSPLPRKLGIKPEARVALLAAPAGLAPLLDPLPGGVSVSTALDGTEPFDVVLAFTTLRAEVADAVESVRPLMAPAGGLWIAWPKRSSGVPTEVTDDLVREIALPTGLVDNKVCAIDSTWTGLRLVIRRELRPRAT